MLIPSEEDIRRIVEKHVHSISLPIKAAAGVDVTKALTEAVRQASPHKPPRDSDIQAIVKQLAMRSQVDNREIQETARTIVHASDAEELRAYVLQLLNKLKAPHRTISAQDADAVIRANNLTPAHSSISDIKRAVERYLSQRGYGRNVEEDKLRQVIRNYLRQYGPVDEREVTRYVNQYYAYSDQSKPFNPAEAEQLIASQKPRVPAGILLPPEAAQPRANVIPINRPPAKLTFFDTIRNKLARYGIQPLTQEARNWLQDNIRKAAAPTQEDIFRRSKVASTITQAFIGQMFFYSYDAKWKDELPYWDAFPLTVIVELYHDGWMGLNLHYLPIDLRVALLGQLLSFADNTSLDDVKRLQISYTFLKSFATSSLALPCVKRYLADHVSSYLLPIKPVDYETAVFLPVEQFQKQSKQQVWRESRRMASSMSSQGKMF